MTRAFAEYQKSKRFDATILLLKDMGASAFAAIPMIKDFVETVTGKAAQTVPKFETAQQAMAYLHLSLDVERFATCFTKTDQDLREVAKQGIEAFDYYSRLPNEQAMLAEARPVIRTVLRSREFRAIAEPEEWIAAKFILGRAAIYAVMLEHD